MECLNTDFDVMWSKTSAAPITILTRRVPLVGQELPTLPEHLSSPLVFSGVRVTRSLVLCVCFVDRCLYFCTSFWPLCCLYYFDLRILITPLVSSSSSYWLILQYYSDIGDLSRFWLSCLGLLVHLPPKLKKINLDFHTFKFERTWWNLFQKHVIHTFDVYVFLIFNC